MRKSSRVARGIRTTRADQRAVAGRARVRFGDARKDQRACRAEERPARGGLYDAGSIEGQRPPPFMMSDPTPERGGRSKRYYELTARGARALKQSTTTAKRISDAVEKLRGFGKWKLDQI